MGRRFAQEALKAALAGDAAMFYVAAATAIEHLAKALLCSKHQSLIVEQRDLDGLLHAAGEPTAAKRPVEETRTIGIQEALERVERLYPAFTKYRRELTSLVRKRNALVHAGFVDEVTALRDQAAFIRGATELARRLGESPADLWGDLEDAATSLASRSAKEAEASVARKLAAARLRYKSRFAGVSDETIKAIVAGLAPVEDTPEIQAWECPACGASAEIAGSLEAEWGEDFDFGDEVDQPEAIFLIPYHLRCRACGLELDGDAELAAADIPDALTPREPESDVPWFDV